MEYMNLPNFYTHTASHTQSSALIIDQLGRDISSPGFSYPHYNNTYVISVVRNGKGTLEANGKKYNLSKNDAFITLPNELSIQTADQQDPWEVCFFSFSGTLSNELLEKTVFKGNSAPVTLKTAELAEEIINSAYLLNTRTHSDFTLLEIFFRLLSFLDAQKTVLPAEIDESQNKYVSEIKKYIQANYLEPIKISDIAEKLSINRSHLYRIFKSEMGIGVEDYIINIRINHAKVLLKDTSLSVSAVAALVGYKNYTTFFKRFKLATGLTPLEYRNT